MLTANQVADHLLLLARRRGEPVENLKLQKLLYYAQAWHLALFDEPLFEDELEAWMTGPAVPSVFWRFEDHGIHDIDQDVTDPELARRQAEFLDEVAAEYLRLSEHEMEMMSRREVPWLNARRDVRDFEPSDAKLSHEDMRAYFRARLSVQPA